MSKTRYHSLDSLRGIASLQVLISHSMMAVPLLANWVYTDDSSKRDTIFFLIHSPLSFMWSDSAAVKVFFVLSGFVLSLPYYNNENRTPSYITFFIKRIIRLYLPCFTIIILSLFCKWLLYKPNSLNSFGEWVKLMWTMPLNTATLINLVLLKNDLIYFDRALWTLPPEIKLSLILPPAIYILKPLNFLITIMVVIGYVIIWHALNKMGARNIWSDYPTLYYFTFFILGSLVCKYRLLITDWINRISLFWYYVLLFVMLMIYTFKYSMFWLPSLIYNFLNSINDYVSAVAAILILFIVLSNRAYGFLNTKALLFLGKISFSLYLVHIVVIASLAHLFHQYLSAGLIVCIAFLCSFPMAVIFYYCVEMPSLNIANVCSKAFAKKYFFKKTIIYK